MEASFAGRFRGGVILIAAVLAVHLLFGLFALAMNGSFYFGATAIERYVLHLLSADETHFSLSGAPADFVSDLCLQECATCPMHCYPNSNVKLLCGDSCRLQTVKGTVIASEKQYFSYVVKNALLLENATFLCYNRSISDCGFTISLGGNYSMSYNIPAEMKST